jgi:hypothetical protein
MALFLCSVILAGLVVVMLIGKVWLVGRNVGTRGWP